MGTSLPPGRYIEMDRYPNTAVSTSQASVLATNKVLRNTYLLLGATLAFSAVTAGIAMAINLPFMGLWMLLPYFGLVYAVNATRNSCLLYTSDAADERSSVDLGGRRIIKK